MNKSLKMAAAVALMATFAIVAIGPTPFPDDDAGPSGNFKVAIGPTPFPDDDAGPSGNFIGPTPFPDDEAGPSGNFRG